MARFPLFSALRRLASTTVRNIALEAHAPELAPCAERAVSRRELVQHAVALAGVAALGCSASIKDPNDTDGPTAHRIAVIGAGLAGLHCAYRLRDVGVEVTVYEASERVGGRMYTARNVLPEQLICELGGEFIDSAHVTLQALADEFRLELDDRLRNESASQEVWWVNGAQVPEATILAQFVEVAPALLEAFESAEPKGAAGLQALDATPLSAWLDENVPPALYPELFAVLTSAYRGEFGLETDQQSSLNLIYLIGSDDTSSFRIFGESDERYHVHEGNDAIPKRLADKLGERVKTGHRLVRIQQLGPSYRLTFERRNGTGFIVEADRVVFAVPFSVLRRIDLGQVELTETKRRAIAELGYGTNAKIIGALNARPWEARGSNGSVTSDGKLQQVWDSSIGQTGGFGVLTNFLGGEAGENAGDGTSEERMVGLLSELEAIFPGVVSSYVPESALRMHWSSNELFRGSYACYRPRQWTEFHGTEGQREGNLHFCGEHCSRDFQGWMEGAAETGLLVAAEIIDELDVAQPLRLQEMLAPKLVVPQPGYRGSAVERLPPLARRRRLLLAHAERAQDLRLRRTAWVGDGPGE